MKKKERKRNFMPLVVLTIGVVLGGILIGFGIYNNANSDYDAFNIKSEEELKADVSAKIKEVETIKSERDEEYKVSALSDKYEELSRKLSTAEGELYDAEEVLFHVQNGDYDNLKRDKILGSVPLIALGVAVIVFAIGLMMKMTNAKKKNVILTISEEK